MNPWAPAAQSLTRSTPEANDTTRSNPLRTTPLQRQKDNLGKTTYQNHQSRSTLLRPDVYVLADDLFPLTPGVEDEDATDPAKDQIDTRIPTAIVCGTFLVSPKNGR